MPDPDPWTLCPAGIADIPTLARLHAACFADAWSVTDFAKLLAMPGMIAILARKSESSGSDQTCSDQACGFALLRYAADEAEILTIGVLPSERRRSLGRRLLEAALDCAAQLSVRQVFIEVDTNNAPALALYRARGFVECGRRRGYYRYHDGRTADALTMRCEVTGTFSAP
ncbi:GNAT family N-acetyltransferase [Rhodoligotrophos ferricapiens]|uniref:GNAT family N-acetyltransferase n=1 Tax=Rhodoligotrophos ferricapiens TaxID=3069264 RepID=UPI00315D1D0E